MTSAMSVQGIYACLAVADFDKSIDYYTRLMGREPDDRPMSRMAQWRNMNGAGLQLWHDEANAGHSRITIVVPVMATERSRLEAAGVTLGEDVPGEWGIVVQIADPDGNQVTLAEPPKGFSGT
jgi:catechol 2,3-dioxygenase-like lactoylglutathione lyase family enzyme